MGVVALIVIAGLIWWGISALVGGSEPLPSVVGTRLDVAIDNLKDAGYDHEVIGGGTFGVLDESAWTVCAQDPAPGVETDDPVELVVDRTCGPSAGGAGPPVDPGGDAAVAVIPNVVGMDLQAAQDTLQAAGFYNLRSHDATGQNRFQVADRNWVVVSQTPQPGLQTSTDVLIDLGAKKIGE
ncbi:MAG: PASTA domain-containing protein [Actinomycetota bacterium]